MRFDVDSRGCVDRGTATLTRLLTVEQVAELLQCSSSTIWKAVGAGSIPHVRISDRTIRFHPEVLEAWTRGTTTTEGTND